MSDQMDKPQAQDTAPAPGRSRLMHFLRETVSIVVGAATIAFVFNTMFFAQYDIPSESMVPTLLVGDRVVVAKWSYGYSRYSLPLGLGGLLPAYGRLFGSVPERGDVIVFVNPHTGEDYIKRVIGLPGDRVEMRKGQLFINDEAVGETFVRAYAYREYRGGVAEVDAFEEQLPGADDTHLMIDRGPRPDADNYGPALVPDGHLFMMGDNRDNSNDSRMGLGFVPLENIVGRALAISVSFADCQELEVPECPGRTFTGLR